MTAKERAAQFAVECLDPEGEADLLAIKTRYGAWAATRPNGGRNFSPAHVGKALAELFEETGIAVAERDGKLMVVGVSLKPTSSPITTI